MQDQQQQFKANQDRFQQQLSFSYTHPCLVHSVPSPRTTRRGVWRHGRRRRTRATSLLRHRGRLPFHEGLIRPHAPKHRTARCHLCRPRWGGRGDGSRGGSSGRSRGGSRGGGHTALGEGTVQRLGLVRRTMLQFRYGGCGPCRRRSWWRRRWSRWRQGQWWRQRCRRFGGKMGPSRRCARGSRRGTALARPVLLRRGSVLCGRAAARLLPWSRRWLPSRVRARRRRPGGQRALGRMLARQFLTGSGARTGVRVRRGEVVQHARRVRRRVLRLVPTRSDP